MKIIILSPSINIVGGVERFSQYLKNIFEESGHQVQIIYPVQNKITYLFSKIGLGAPLSGYQLGKVAKEQSYDVVITNGLLGWNIKSKNIINIQHGTFAASADRIDKGRNYLKWFIKKYIWGYFEMLSAKHASVVVAVSKETAEFVKKYYNIEVVKVIENTIDFDLFSKKDKVISRNKFLLPIDKGLLLFVGRFEYGKGSDIMLKCVNSLVKRGMMLVVASDQSMNLPGIVFLKNINYNDLPYLYSACDVFIFPSRHEGSSLALLEAMALGLPFLASRVGLVSQFKEQGLFKECVVEDQTKEAYINKLDLLLSLSNSEKEKLSSSIKDYVIANHSNKDFEMCYLKLLNDLVYKESRNIK